MSSANMKSFSYRNPCSLMFDLMLLLILLVSCFCNYVSCSKYSNVSTTATTSSSLITSCLSDQTTALLQFKGEFAFTRPNFSSYYYGCPRYSDAYYDADAYESYPKMKFWKKEKDCCSWDGVTCNTKTGKVVALDLANSWLQGPLRSNSSLFKLHGLQRINLSFNNFSFSVIPSEFGQLSRLTHLNLSFSMFSGHIPYEISFLTHLFSLSFSSFLNYNATSLLHLGKVDFTNLIQNMTSLRHLRLHQVNISSSCTSLNLGGCTNLEIISVPTSKIPKFQSLFLSSCNINEFPEFLKTQDQLKLLDLSWNKIESEIPKWFWVIGKNLEVLNLEGNKLHGSITIPPLFTSISYFFISQNNLTGIIHPSFRKWTCLKVLDMSKNHIGGTIPRWLGSSLEILNLQGNNFNGSIPHKMFTYGSINNTMRVLDLSHNQFQGKVPQSLINCSKLQVLNLGHNKISDTFPFWLQTLPELQVLVLRSNNFFGPIWYPIKYLGFPNLGTMDLSFNHFSGSLPSEYFRNWDYMSKAPFGNKSDIIYFGKNKEWSRYFVTYTYSMTMMNKGLEMEFMEALTIFMSIDLSNNRFDGEIPSSIGKLQSLIMLNLSNNNFKGTIPSSLGILTELESLDLSENKFSGRIPQQLATLTFLAYLNLSQNQFVGPIPQGTQLDTFSYSSFEGNPGLCGSQLSKKCENTDTPIPFLSKDEEESKNGFTWKVVVMGYGCGLAVGLVIGHVTLSRTASWFWRSFIGRYFYALC